MTAPRRRRVLRLGRVASAPFRLLGRGLRALGRAAADAVEEVIGG